MAASCGKFYSRDEVLKEVVCESAVENDEGEDSRKKAMSLEDILARTSFKASDMVRKEAMLCFTLVSHRLSGKRTIRNPFYGEISRDIPYEMFSLLVRLVKGTSEYSPPFCYLANNKKGEVVSFSSLRLVVDFLVLLSQYSAEEVSMYFLWNEFAILLGNIGAGIQILDI